MKLCFLGLHNYELLKEEEFVNRRDEKVGIVIISRCKDCGKIYSQVVFTNSDV